jgi:hypothetical protein
MEEGRREMWGKKRQEKRREEKLEGKIGLE